MKQRSHSVLNSLGTSIGKFTIIDDGEGGPFFLIGLHQFDQFKLLNRIRMAVDVLMGREMVSFRGIVGREFFESLDLNQVQDHNQWLSEHPIEGIKT